MDEDHFTVNLVNYGKKNVIQSENINLKIKKNYRTPESDDPKRYF